MGWNVTRKAKVDEVMVEIARFNETVNAWNERILECDTPYSTKESGAMRRASLDLTRSLALMRKPGW